MRKIVSLLLLILLPLITLSQSRGIRVGYIDMEYILENVPSYTEAKNQLEQKAQKWKQDIEIKRNEINALKEALKAEKVLLTKELLEEREEEIAFLEKELIAFQEQKFGPKGDLIVQKTVLVKPIQDQIFTIVQDLAEARKFDFIFDKSSDLTLLFAAKRHDLSDMVIRQMTRAAKREQLSKKELKELEKKEYLEDLKDQNPEQDERAKMLQAKKEERAKLLEERKIAAEAKKKEFEEKRKKLIAEREAKKNGTVSDKPINETQTEEKTTENKETDQNANVNDEKKQTIANDREKAKEAKAKEIEDRKKALEERRQKILADREKAKKEKEEKLKEQQENKN